MSAGIGSEAVGNLPPNPAVHELAVADHAERPEQSSGLFGRGLLYVVVLSFQTVAATIVSPVLAHLIGPGEFGRLAAAIALYQLLTALAVLGLDQAIVLQRAEDGNSRAARGLVSVALVLILVVVGAAALTSRLWGPALGFDGASPLLGVTLLWTLPGAPVGIALALLLAEDRLKVFAVVSAIAAVGGQLVGIVLLLVLGREALIYACGGVVSQVVAFSIAMVAVRPCLRGLADWSIARRAIMLGAPLAVSGIAGFVLNAGDRIIIQRMLGAAEVGRYQVAYTIGYVVVMLLVFVGQAWIPRIAAISDQRHRLVVHEHSRNQLYLLLLPMILGVSLGAPLALRVFAPASFEPETLSIVVFLVALSAFPVAAAGTSGRELLTLRKGRALALVACVAAAANVALNIVLIPYFGITGAAGATVLAFALTAVLQLRMLPRGTPWPKSPVWLWLAIIGVCGAAAASTFLPQTSAWNVGRIVVALACLPWLIGRLKVARDTAPFESLEEPDAPEPPTGIDGHDATTDTRTPARRRPRSAERSP